MDYNKESVQSQYGYLYYEITGGEVMVINVDNSILKPSAEIPAEIEGYPVTAIGLEAFEGTTIKSIKIPDSVKQIDDYAFRYCESLESVTIPRSVTSIGYGVFDN